MTYLDGEFKRASLRTDVLFLNNLAEDLVIERQILEGVRAIVRVTPQAAQKGTIPLRIFHRNVGGSNVRFDGKRPDLNLLISMIADRTQITTTSRLPLRHSWSSKPRTLHPHPRPIPHQLRATACPQQAMAMDNRNPLRPCHLNKLKLRPRPT